MRLHLIKFVRHYFQCLLYLHSELDKVPEKKKQNIQLFSLLSTVDCNKEM